ncbi:dynamin central region family protein [Babesia bovis T2Bo]|uniref:Dynamin central region family protein n=1 Tax=Babesia bovis TaxID=5865 RepID=A7APS6_BABBO|nr:dynamin central region family protein [Babesia bovis T2Bo]EDO08560.1 dynamin central region family protein [Babesia bovis T2Bo]|eukprot:XP_001612128.1 dynamin central region family protein [Babesia bovis T2Bo]
MEQLIPIVSKLHAILAQAGECSPELPAIAVVGAQSVGKSSVLEAIVGRPFLPKGTGIVTQRPLILQLRYDPSAIEYGEFAHKKGVIYSDFNKIKAEIRSETERLLGNTKNVSPVPIFLKIVSPKVVDLTLIDLPGITKVPVNDQTHDIEFQIRRMIMEYIAQPSCIILALTSANTDIATSDSLQMAREVDPQGLRTIGVITKCDIVEDANATLDVLQGKVYKLRRGYVGVVCRDRSTAVADTNHSAQEEERFFQTHHIFSQIANRCGTRHLSAMLNEILTGHIKDILPYVKDKLINMLNEKQIELASYGPSNLADSPSACLLHFFSTFSQKFTDIISGRSTSTQNPAQLSGGARIYYIFNDSYLKTLKAFNPLAGLSDIEVRTAIRNSTGPTSALFVPELAFANLVKKQIQLLEPPSLQCVDQVYEELLNILETCQVEELNRYTNMRAKMLQVVRNLIKQCLGPTKDMIRNMIKIELAYINTNHPDFLKNNAMAEQYQQRPREHTPMHKQHVYRQLPRGPETNSTYAESLQSDTLDIHKKQESFDPYPKEEHEPLLEKPALWLPNIPRVVILGNEPSEREVIEAQLIKTLIESYFSIVRKNITDAVPKCIMHFMVNKTTESVHQELISQLYKKELYEELTAESKHIIERREMCVDSIRSLQQCVVELNELAEYKL